MDEIIIKIDEKDRIVTFSSKFLIYSSRFEVFFLLIQSTLELRTPHNKDSSKILGKNKIAQSRFTEIKFCYHGLLIANEDTTSRSLRTVSPIKEVDCNL